MTAKRARKAMQAIEVTLDEATYAHYQKLARLCRTTTEMAMRIVMTNYCLGLLREEEK